MTWLAQAWQRAEARASTATRHRTELLAAVQARLQVPAPDSRDEAWRYFPLRPLLARSIPRDSEPSPEPAVLASVPTDARSLHIVMLNGVMRSEYTPMEAEGLVIAQEHGPSWFDVKPYLAARDSFSALNVCLSDTVPTIRVKAGTKVDRVLHIHWLMSHGDSHARLRLWLDEEAELRVVEHHHSGSAGSDGKAIGTTLLDAQIGRAARLDVLRRLHDVAGTARLSRSEYLLHDDAQLRWTGSEICAGTARHELQVRYLGPGARAELNQAAVLGQGSSGDRNSGQGNERAYSETRLEHRHECPGTTSRTLWKSLAAGRSRIVFNGRIFMAPGADDTDAALRTASMLLSEHAEVDAKPELEIHAEEVKAAHGATVGQLDSKSLFYLRSRGVPEPAARAMLLQAFVLEVGQGLVDPALHHHWRRDMQALFPEIATAFSSEAESL